MADLKGWREGAGLFLWSHRTDAGASGETEHILSIPSDKEEDEVKAQRSQKCLFADAHKKVTQISQIGFCWRKK